MRRVVVTGMGMACPLGLGVEHVWQRLINAESGIGSIQAFDTKDLPCKVAGQVPTGVKSEQRLDLSEWIPVKDIKKMDRFIHLALVAAAEAVDDSGWQPESEDEKCATGVMIGSGIGGLQTIYDASIQVHEGRARRLSPFFIPSALINLASGHVSIRYGFKGPNHSAVTACATGVHAVGDAARLIIGAMLTSWWQAVPKPRCANWALRVSAPHAPCQRASTTNQPRRRVPGTRIATDLLWGKVRACWSWKSTNMPGNVGRRSTPRSPDTECPATHTI